MSVLAPPTSRFVPLDGARLHYHEAGSGDPVVLVHSAGPGAAGWDRSFANVEELATRHRVLVPDMPGFGESDPIATDFPPVADGWVLTLLAFLDAVGIERASFVGHAHGAIPVLLLAGDHPGRVDQLVLTGPPGAMVAAAPTPGILAMRRLRVDPSPELVREYLCSLVSDPALVTDDLVARRTTAIEEHNRRRLGRPAPAPAPGGDWWADELPERLARVRARTLVVQGAEDGHAVGAALTYLRHLPRADLHVFGGTGSWVDYERADDFNQLVLGFLASGRDKELQP